MIYSGRTLEIKEEAAKNAAHQNFKVCFGPDIYYFLTTIGQIKKTRGVIIKWSDDDGKPSNNELKVLSNLFLRNTPVDSAARGKMALLQGNVISTFQYANSGIKPCWCGNAVAGAFRAFIKNQSLVTDTKLIVKNAKRLATVTASLSGNTVFQTWEVPKTSRFINFGECEGHPYVLIDFLNPYVLVDNRHSLVQINQEEADRLRKKILGERNDGKIAVINKVLNLPPVVDFFTAYGKHGAAPMTGLATLGVAREYLQILKTDQISYRLENGSYRLAKLPQLAINKSSIRLQMPEVDVLISK